MLEEGVAGEESVTKEEGVAEVVEFDRARVELQFLTVSPL